MRDFEAAGYYVSGYVPGTNTLSSRTADSLSRYGNLIVTDRNSGERFVTKKAMTSERSYALEQYGQYRQTEVDSAEREKLAELIQRRLLERLRERNNNLDVVVPEIKTRTIGDSEVIFSAYVPNSYTFTKSLEDSLVSNSGYVEEAKTDETKQRDITFVRLLTILLGNSDVHSDNVLITDEGKLVIIDNEQILGILYGRSDFRRDFFEITPTFNEESYIVEGEEVVIQNIQEVINAFVEVLSEIKEEGELDALIAEAGYTGEKAALVKQFLEFNIDHLEENFDVITNVRGKGVHDARTDGLKHDYEARERMMLINDEERNRLEAEEKALEEEQKGDETPTLWSRVKGGVTRIVGIAAAALVGYVATLPIASAALGATAAPVVGSLLAVAGPIAIGVAAIGLVAGGYYGYTRVVSPLLNSLRQSSTETSIDSLIESLEADNPDIAAELREISSEVDSLTHETDAEPSFVEVTREDIPDELRDKLIEAVGTDDETTLRAHLADVHAGKALLEDFVNENKRPSNLLYVDPALSREEVEKRRDLLDRAYQLFDSASMSERGKLEQAFNLMFGIPVIPQEAQEYLDTIEEHPATVHSEGAENKNSIYVDENLEARVIKVSKGRHDYDFTSVLKLMRDMHSYTLDLNAEQEVQVGDETVNVKVQTVYDDMLIIYRDAEGNYKRVVRQRYAPGKTVKEVANDEELRDDPKYLAAWATFLRTVEATRKTPGYVLDISDSTAGGGPARGMVQNSGNMLFEIVDGEYIFSIIDPDVFDTLPGVDKFDPKEHIRKKGIKEGIKTAAFTAVANIARKYWVEPWQRYYTLEELDRSKGEEASRLEKASRIIRGITQLDIVYEELDLVDTSGIDLSEDIETTIDDAVTTNSDGSVDVHLIDKALEKTGLNAYTPGNIEDRVEDDHGLDPDKNDCTDGSASCTFVGATEQQVEDTLKDMSEEAQDAKEQISELEASIPIIEEEIREFANEIVEYRNTGIGGWFRRHPIVAAVVSFVVPTFIYSSAVLIDDVRSQSYYRLNVLDLVNTKIELARLKRSIGETQEARYELIEAHKLAVETGLIESVENPGSTLPYTREDLDRAMLTDEQLETLERRSIAQKEMQALGIKRIIKTRAELAKGFSVKSLEKVAKQGLTGEELAAIGKSSLGSLELWGAMLVEMEDGSMAVLKPVLDDNFLTQTGYKGGVSALYDNDRRTLVSRVLNEFEGTKTPDVEVIEFSDGFKAIKSSFILGYKSLHKNVGGLDSKLSRLEKDILSGYEDHQGYVSGQFTRIRENFARQAVSDLLFSTADSEKGIRMFYHGVEYVRAALADNDYYLPEDISEDDMREVIVEIGEEKVLAMVNDFGQEFDVQVADVEELDALVDLNRPFISDQVYRVDEELILAGFSDQYQTPSTARVKFGEVKAPLKISADDLIKVLEEYNYPKEGKFSTERLYDIILSRLELGDIERIDTLDVPVLKERLVQEGYSTEQATTIIKTLYGTPLAGNDKVQVLLSAFVEDGEFNYVGFRLAIRENKEIADELLGERKEDLEAILSEAGYDDTEIEMLIIALKNRYNDLGYYIDTAIKAKGAMVVVPEGIHTNYNGDTVVVTSQGVFMSVDDYYSQFGGQPTAVEVSEELAATGDGLVSPIYPSVNAVEDTIAEVHKATAELVETNDLRQQCTSCPLVLEATRTVTEYSQDAVNDLDVKTAGDVVKTGRAQILDHPYQARVVEHSIGVMLGLQLLSVESTNAEFSSIDQTAVQLQSDIDDVREGLGREDYGESEEALEQAMDDAEAVLDDVVGEAIYGIDEEVET